MTTPAPLFYRKTGDRKWPYEVIAPMHFRLGQFDEDYFVHAKSTGQLLGTLKADGLLTVFPGYRFDGATFAPDIKSMMRSILLHDFLCQCCEHHLWPIDRYEADLWFHTLGLIDKASYISAYYSVVRALGGVHRFFFPPQPARGITITMAEPLPA